MNTPTTICLSLIFSINLLFITAAANENIDHSKPHIHAVNSLDNNCNGSKVCTPQKLRNNPQCNPLATLKSTSANNPLARSSGNDSSQSSTCLKPMNRPASTLAARTMATKATDYNSSRSNKSY